ncbi:hypothetical protein ACB092_10G202800 [Castanea dentata]
MSTRPTTPLGEVILPFSSSSPGTVVDMLKTTVTKRPATIEHAFDVSLSHFPPSSTSFLWVSMKMSLGVLPSLLER